MKYFRYVIIACSLFLSVSCSSPSSDSQGQIGSTLDYRIVSRQDVSYAATPRMVFRVMLNVDEIPTDESMRTLAEALWNDGNKNWKEFTVFIYLPTMNTNESAYGIAEYRPSGLKEFTTSDWALIGTKWENQADASGRNSK